MTLLYAYAFRVNRSYHPDEIRQLGDLGGEGLGPDMLDVVRNTLTEGVEFPPPPDAEDAVPREHYYTVDHVTNMVEGRTRNRLLLGRVSLTRAEEAGDKIQRDTGDVHEYEQGDPGIRPLFFLFSAPVTAEQALIIMERSGNYTQTQLWRDHVGGAIKSSVPLQDNDRSTGITVQWGQYGALSPGEFFEQHVDGIRSVTTITELDDDDNDGGGGGDYRVVLNRDQQVPNRPLMRRLIDRVQHRDVAEQLMGGFVELPRRVDQTKIETRVGDRERTIVVGRDEVPQLAEEVPDDAPRDGRFVTLDYLVDMAQGFAASVGHDQVWLERSNA